MGKKSNKKGESIKHVKTRVECLRNGSSAFDKITCRMTWVKSTISLIHSNISTYLNKDNMAPLQFIVRHFLLRRNMFFDLIIHILLFIFSPFVFFFCNLTPVNRQMHHVTKSASQLHSGKYCIVQMLFTALCH